MDVLLPPFPRYDRGQRIAFFLGTGLVLMTVSLLAGWCAGWVWNQIDTMTAMNDIAAQGPDARPTDLLAQLDRLIGRFPANARLLDARAELCLRLADRDPGTQSIYLVDARLSAEAAWNLDARAAGFSPNDPAALGRPKLFARRCLYAQTLVQCDAEREAMGIFNQLLAGNLADHNPATVSTLCNSAAWSLLTGPESLRDYPRGLELAKRCMKTDRNAVRNAAYLDTLAVAYWRNRQDALALEVSRRSLALASLTELKDLLSTYDLIASGPAAP